jgi:DNA processing protein
MALGIDVAAHEGALDAGGATIGVLPSPAPDGVRQGARRLAARVVECGALLSDRPPGTPAAAWSFVTRNTLLAALCDGLIVVEAPEGSGALITAEAADGFGLPLAFVSAPFGSVTAAGGAAWFARASELSLHLIERRAPHLLTDRATLQAWLSVCAASVYADGEVGKLSLQHSGGVPPIGGLRGAILQRLESAGVAGLAEGDLLDLSRGAEAALPAALTLLAAQGLIEQRGGRWRGSEGAVLRSRA